VLIVGFFESHLKELKLNLSLLYSNLVRDIIVVENLHKTIRRYREDKGICRIKMSERLGMTLNGYGKIERGEVEVTISRLLEISEILQIPITHFFQQNAIANESVILAKSSDNNEKQSIEVESQFDPFVYIEFLESRINYLKSQLSKFQ
jgi:transcriptional regulator with XRE-family HTH domain